MTRIETEVIEKLANSQVGESLKQAVLRLLASHGRTTANHKACLEKIKELNEKLETEGSVIPVDNVAEA